jgi:hypothetical protein
MKSKIGVLFSRVDFVQAKTAIYQDQTMAAIRDSQEKTEAATSSIRAEL